jgi:penicillin-binding protein 1C
MPIPPLRRRYPPAPPPRRERSRGWQRATELSVRAGHGLGHAAERAGGRTLPWFRRLRRRYFRRWRTTVAALALLGVVFAVGVVAWYSRDLPNPNKLSDRTVAESTRIFARDSTTLLYEIHGDKRRTVVDLPEIPRFAVEATIAIEDRDFYKHKGFSVRGILRAVFQNLIRGGSAQGGSTITQQFIKNAILTNEKTVTRKVKELVLAFEMERRFSKDQILKLYFNEIPYGSNAYGIEAAARTFFGKPARDLDLPEAALIAALPKAPTYYSPFGSHRDDLVNRWRYALDSMADQGYITKAEAETAKQVDILKRLSPVREAIRAPHFVFYVKELLTERLNEKMVEQGGLRVVTTLDPKLQDIAEEVVEGRIPTNEKRYGAENAALVAIDPKTGQILAMVGSRDYFDTEHDGQVNVALTPQAPGSSLKPFIYATAFGLGYTPDTVLFDLVTRFKTDSGKDYVPRNYDGKEHGPLSMRSALAGSLNIPAVKTLYLAGLDRVLDQLDRLGYTTFTDRSRFGLSVVLGGGEVKLLEHVAAFGALVNDGILHPKASILKVEDRRGKTLLEFRDRSERVLDQNVARLTNSILTDNNARAFIFGAKNSLTLPDRLVAAKTGTTDGFRDGWTLGGVPGLVAGVWAGKNDNSSMRPGSDGVVVAAPIWHEFLVRALKGKKADSFPKPKKQETTKPVLNGKLLGGTPVSVDSVTGRRIPERCLEVWPKEFVEQKTVKAIHDVLYYVTKDEPNGPPPDNPAADPQFDRWEGPVQKWSKDHGYTEAVPGEESCDLRTDAAKPTISITNPSAGAVVTSSSVVASVSVGGPRPAVKVAYTLDGAGVGDTAVTPFSLALDFSALTAGDHALVATVTDDVGNTGTASTTFAYSPGAGTASYYFLDPLGALSVATGGSITLKAFASHPEGVASVAFSYLDAANASHPIGSTDTLSENTATVTWSGIPAGDSKAYFVVTTPKGTTLTSDSVTITGT